MYTQIPKDVSKIEAKMLGPFTFRQLIGLIVAVLVGFPTFYIASKFLPTELSMYVLVLIAVPPLLIANYKKRGIPAEQLLISFVRFKYLYNQKRIYKSNSSVPRDFQKKKRKGKK